MMGDEDGEDDVMKMMMMRERNGGGQNLRSLWDIFHEQGMNGF